MALSFNAYRDYTVRPLPGWDTYRITLVKYPFDNLGKETKVTSIYSMLNQTVAGKIDHMGKVEKPETLKRSPRYKYNPGNISRATQLQPGVIPIISTRATSCLTPL